MGLDDLLIKKYIKKYIKHLLLNWLKKANKKDLRTPESISNYLSEQLETLYEKAFLK